MSSIISLRKTSGVTFKLINNNAESGVKYRVLCRDVLCCLGTNPVDAAKSRLLAYC